MIRCLVSNEIERATRGMLQAVHGVYATDLSAKACSKNSVDDPSPDFTQINEE